MTFRQAVELGACVRKGEHVSTGQRIAMFHDPKQIWVQANVKESSIPAWMQIIDPPSR